MSSKKSSLVEELILLLLDGAWDIKMSTTEAVPKGENYFGKIFRVNVSYKHGTDVTQSYKSFIVKMYPEDVMKAFLIESGAMIKEITMYKNIIPKQNQICGRKLAPLFYESNKNDLLILEDLSFNGFSLQDRIELMDFNHCKRAIESLADFHATSVILHNKNPSMIEEIGKEVLYIKNNGYMKSFIVNCFNVLGNEVENWPECSKYSRILGNSGEKTWKMVLEALKPVEGEINVLNHGDFWTNNILFSHSKEGGIEKVKLIDFQFCRWTTPAFDLHCFFNTSVRNRKDIPVLIIYYLDRFNELLQNQLNIKLTVDQLTKYLRQLDCYGLIATVCLLPTCVRSREKPLDYKNVTRENYDKNFETDNPYVKACKDPTYRKIASEMLEYYSKEGILC